MISKNFYLTYPQKIFFCKKLFHLVLMRFAWACTDCYSEKKTQEASDANIWFFFFPLQNSIFSRIPSLKFWLLQPLQTSISVCSIQFHFLSGNCLQLGIIGFSHLSSFKNHNPWLLLDFVWKKVIFSVVSWFELFWGAQFLTCYSLMKQNWF